MKYDSGSRFAFCRVFVLVIKLFCNMQLRPRTWFLISLALFVTSALFWRMGENRSRTRQQQLSTNSSETLRSNAEPKQLQTNKLSSSTAQSPSSAQEFPYRLVNTAVPAEQLLHKPTALLFQNALIDTASSQPV